LAGAKSLADGHGYRMILYDDSPAIGLYPPLQSLFLAALWLLDGRFPENIALLNAGMVFLVVTSVAMLFLALRRCGMARAMAMLVPLCLAAQPMVYDAAFSVMSDILFSVLGYSLAILWLGKTPGSPAVRWLGTGLILGLMYLTRTAAAPLLLGAIT